MGGGAVLLQASAISAMPRTGCSGVKHLSIGSPATSEEENLPGFSRSRGFDIAQATLCRSSSRRYPSRAETRSAVALRCGPSASTRSASAIIEACASMPTAATTSWDSARIGAAIEYIPGQDLHRRRQGFAHRGPAARLAALSCQ